MLDEQKLLEFLRRKAKEAPVGDAPLLVQHAIYEGLAERVKSGEFDMDADDQQLIITALDHGGFEGETLRAAIRKKGH